ncbi:hypothetical protein IQ264_27000 [Phormidium sp. LEGE 05292]|uniref:hypothetical protein n=1 Tax=[Phormidium] sp. LEGE 05292 TaxID=767427 RepID=UPI001880A663|nr:hypothetical protein [Phormidium sp. LEGE 05292]MBE9229061.1 hypothetical protein [Phormidium sp. LEGE 05292]
MSTASKYWLLIRLDATGNSKIEEITVAKAFFTSIFPELISSENLLDAQIQCQLWENWQTSLVANQANKISTSNNARVHPAELCLRCFISSVIQQVCIQLEINFGKNYGFTRHDLFPLVLNDVIERSAKHQQSSYTSVALEILQTYNPERGNLSNWTSKLVKQHRELKAFLIEHGVYLVTDWAILNDTNSEQLQRIFQEFHHLTESEIRLAAILLESYHRIYRRDRRTARKLGRQGQCLPPTTEQLQQISQLFQQKINLEFKTSEIMSRLHNIAKLLREYRIYIKSGTYKNQSLDAPAGNSDNSYTLGGLIPSTYSTSEQDEENEFLQFYRSEFMNSLDLALKTIINHRLSTLKKQNIALVNQFVIALHLYHCQGQSMVEIAQKIGLQAQYQVTRLLKLKQLRTEVRQLMLKKLLSSVLNRALLYTEFKEAKNLEQQIEEILDRQIEDIFQKAEAESTVTKNRPLPSLFARRVCYIANQIQ